MFKKQKPDQKIGMYHPCVQMGNQEAEIGEVYGASWTGVQSAVAKIRKTLSQQGTESSPKN